MHIYPAGAADKLGFGIVLGRIRSYLCTAEGGEDLTREHPASDMRVVTDRLAAVSDVQTLLTFDDPISWGELPDVRPFLKTIRPADSVPDSRDLLDLLAVTKAAAGLRTYLASRTEKYPSLLTLSQQVADLSAPQKVIEKSIGRDGEILDAASEKLARVRRAIASREQELRKALQKELRQAIAAGHATEEQPTIRNGRMVIPVRAEAKRKVKGFVQDTSATGQTVFIEPEACLHLNNDLRELQAEERQEERRVLMAIGDTIRRSLDEIIATTSALARFDVLQAKAHVAKSLHGIVPSLNDSDRILVRDGRNPALALHFSRDAEAARQVVPLDLAMDRDRRSLLITGPNAGGKTIALGTIGLFSVMIAHGIPVPAGEGTDLPVFAKLFVDIGDEQSIEDDLSTFSSHMRNVREMVRGADARSLVLIDEAGTGTDPEEGAALAQAALEALHEAGAWTIATTHHGRLKAFAHHANWARNAAMEFDVDSLSPTYRLRMDVPGSSYAFEIGRRMQLPAALLERARELVGTPKMSLEELIVDYEARLARMASDEEAARRALREAQASREDYETRRKELDKSQARSRLEALEEGRRVMQKANALVERTIREIRESQANRATTRTARRELEDYRDRLDKSIDAARLAVTETEAKSLSQDSGESIGVGDQVVLDGGDVKAEVVVVDGDEVVIATGTMHMRVDRARLRKVGGKREQQVTVRSVSGDATTLSSHGLRQRIDVRGYRVNEALSEVGRFVDAALPSSLKRLEILHGTGTGALRKAIQDYLDGRPDVRSYEEAEWEQGGAGVTVVHLS